MRRNHVPTGSPAIANFPKKVHPTNSGSRWHRKNHPDSLGIPRLCWTRPSPCTQMAAERIPKKFIGAVEDEWQLYRYLLSPSARSAVLTLSWQQQQRTGLHHRRTDRLRGLVDSLRCHLQTETRRNTNACGPQGPRPRPPPTTGPQTPRTRDAADVYLQTPQRPSRTRNMDGRS